MTNFHNVLLLSLGLTLGSYVVAQNEITIGIKPGQTTTGSSSNGSPGSIGVTIGGYGTVPVNVPPGTGSAGIATATASALTAAGFTVTQSGLEVKVTAGPGGAPLKFGGGIGSTDTGVTGVSCKVKKPAPGGGGGPGGGGPGAGGGAGKQNGGAVRQAKPNAQAQGPGSIQIDVEVRKLVNGVWTLMWIQVQIQIQPGDDQQTIDQRVRQQLQAAGLVVNSVTLPPSIAPITPVPPGCFGFDRTVDGGIVEGLGWDMFGSAWDLFGTAEANAGRIPERGVAEFDQAIDQSGTETEDFHFFQGEARIGLGGSLEALVLPNQFSVWIIGNGLGGPGLMAPVVPLPFVDPNFYMPFDPFGALTLGGISDPLGQMHLSLPIPPMPSLVGLELHTAALTLDPFAPTLFDGARRTNGLTIRIDN